MGALVSDGSNGFASFLSNVGGQRNTLVAPDGSMSLTLDRNCSLALLHRWARPAPAPARRPAAAAVTPGSAGERARGSAADARPPHACPPPRNGSVLWTALINNKVVAACTLSIQTNGRLMVSSVSSGAVLWSNEVFAPGSGPFTLTLTNGRMVETDNSGNTRCAGPGHPGLPLPPPPARCPRPPQPVPRRLRPLDGAHHSPPPSAATRAAG
jgi:hypothetical protein